MTFLSGNEFVESSLLADDVSVLRGGINELLKAEPADLIRAKRLSFGSSDAVLYPTTLDDTRQAIAEKTLILQALELSSSSVGDLCTALSSATGRPVGASAYLSMEGSEAFDWHVDVWDSLIVQIDGCKTFELRDHDDVTLSSGDVLMFRQGVEHRTRTVGHSVHLSLSVRD